MKVKAKVWRGDTFVPTQGIDVFVDTNVLLFWHYPDLSTGAEKATINSYMKVIESLLNAGCTLKWSPFSFAEVAHCVERHLFKTWELKTTEKDKSKKAFRHAHLQERLKVVVTVQTVWAAISENGAPLQPFSVSAEQVADCVPDFRNWSVDAYDLWMVSSAIQEKTALMLTHDVDMISVPGLNLLTLNQRAIDVAKDAKLLQN